MTDRLYYTDSTVTAFSAAVVRVDDTRTRVVLDRTAFYPTSGGQPHDVGTLNDLAVVDVTEDGADVVHHLAEPLPPHVVAVDGAVDWGRRHDHMQQHSGQHLLSALLDDRYGWPTVSVHLGRDGCSLDLAVDDVPASLLPSIEQQVNALVSEQRVISVSFEDAASATGLRKPSSREGTLRIVTIDGLDRNACGGTHVTHTGAIGPILLRRTERTRGVTRLEFRCGERAITRARQDAQLLQQTAALLSTAPEEVPALVAELQTAARHADKERARLEDALVTHEARALYEATPPDTLGRRLCRRTLTDAPVKSLQSLAQHFVKAPSAIFIATSSAPPAVLLAASDDCAVRCGPMLREALQGVGGRGGGADHLAQGSAPTADAATVATAQLLKALSAITPPR